MPGLGEEWTRLMILGPVMASVLTLRNRLVLHGAGVETGRGCVGFLGPSGAGKSTLAGYLANLDRGILGDDMIPIDIDGGEPRVSPTLPRVRLWPDSVQALGDDLSALQRVVPELDKRQRVLDPLSTVNDPQRLLGLFVLGQEGPVSLSPLPSSEALMALVALTYGAAWLHPVNQASLFQVRAAIARRVPAWTLNYPRTPKGMATALELVDETVSLHGPARP